MSVQFHDILAGLFAVILLVGVLVLLVLGQPVPEWLIAAVSSAMAFVFGRSIPGNLSVPAPRLPPPSDHN